MGLSFWQIAIVVLLVVLLFGRGKLSALMGDMAKGIKSFKAGMAEDVAVDDKSGEAMPGDDAKPVQSSVAKDDRADETAKS
ncbi:MAG: twin-arginine translocase TatA/TatE family subunit [Alphaproteobacteria bacterium]|jgi:sec-independent protein translocase protein TatA